MQSCSAETSQLEKSKVVGADPPTTANGRTPSRRLWQLNLQAGERRGEEKLKMVDINRSYI
jgi:hypothetical protein